MKLPVKPLILVATLAAVLLAGADAARRVKSGHGRWNTLARNLYHAAQGAQARAASLPAERADAPMLLYGGTAGDGWQDWSWGTHDLKHPGHAGKAAIFLSPAGNRGIYLHHDAFDTGGYGSFQAFVSGDTATRVCLVDGAGKFLPYAVLTRYLHPDPAGRIGWHLVRIPLAALDVPHGGQAVSGVVFQPEIAARTPLLVDDLSLMPDPSLPAAPTAATVAVTVNARAGRHAISPLIYGMAMAPEDYVSDLRLPLNRWGGNDKSRYDWVLGNAENAAHDWGYRNRTASNAVLPPASSSAADALVRADRAHGAATLLTVPTIGWVARDADNGNASTNVPDGGGPGLAGAEGAIAGYNPAANRSRTSVRSVARKGAPFTDRPSLTGGVVYQDEWVYHLKKTFGDGAHGGVQFFAMDNEPDLWDSTHTDVHPARMGYDDVLRSFLDYATAVKAVDPTALVTGPVSWGWTGYNHSALDRGDDNFKTSADQARHGGTPFLPWFLGQVRAHDARTGARSLDVLDVHFYPQAAGVFSGQTDKATQALRLRATRSLWDPTYSDESWVGVPVRLIPRLKEWIASGYPGTRLGITEWNFGADPQINGGLAIADVLGIFGREDVYLADYWAYPNKDSPGYLAFKLYRSPDGRGNGFGDVSCAASSADQGRLGVYAATDSRTGELTLMLINKMSKATITAPLTIKGVSPAGTVKMWRCDADNPKGIAAYPSALLPSVLTLPPQSMTLLRVPLEPAAPGAGLRAAFGGASSL